MKLWGFINGEQVEIDSDGLPQEVQDALFRATMPSQDDVADVAGSIASGTAASIASVYAPGIDAAASIASGTAASQRVEESDQFDPFDVEDDAQEGSEKR